MQNNNSKFHWSTAFHIPGLTSEFLKMFSSAQSVIKSKLWGRQSWRAVKFWRSLWSSKGRLGNAAKNVFSLQLACNNGWFYCCSINYFLNVEKPEGVPQMLATFQPFGTCFKNYGVHAEYCYALDEFTVCSPQIMTTSLKPHWNKQALCILVLTALWWSLISFIPPTHKDNRYFVFIFLLSALSAVYLFVIRFYVFGILIILLIIICWSSAKKEFSE